MMHIVPTARTSHNMLCQKTGIRASMDKNKTEEGVQQYETQKM